MSYSTSAWGGVVTPNGDENVDVITDLAGLKTSIDGDLVPHFADTATAEAAAAPYIAADSTWRGKCTIEDQFAIYVFGGSDRGWSWAGDVLPVRSTFGANVAGSVFSAGAGWPMLTWTTWTPANYTFTPTKSGWVEISINIDVVTNSTGFAFASARPYFTNNNGVTAQAQLDEFKIQHDTTVRSWNRYTVSRKQAVVAGRQCALSVQFASTAAGGSYSFGGFEWLVVQQ